jgi:hypothetical protein
MAKSTNCSSSKADTSIPASSLEPHAPKAGAPEARALEAGAPGPGSCGIPLGGSTAAGSGRLYCTLTEVTVIPCWDFRHISTQRGGGELTSRGRSNTKELFSVVTRTSHCTGRLYGFTAVCTA